MFQGSKLTKLGQKFLAERKKIILTDMSIGEKYFNEIENVTALASEKMRTQIEKITVLENSYTVRATFSNENIEKGFYVREIGIWALDEDTNQKFLYAYDFNAAEADFLGGGNETEIIKEIIEDTIQFSNAENVSLTINPELVYVTFNDLANENQNGLQTSENFTLVKKLKENLAETNVKIDTNLKTAKSYSDNNLKTAKSYSDTKATDAVATAKTYSDTNLKSAKSYTDTKVLEHQNNTNIHISASERTKWNNKVDKETGKGLSSNDYNNTEKSNVNTAYTHSQSAHAPTNAEKNIQSDWNVTNTNSDAYIKNKPTTFQPASHKHTKSEITDFPTSLPANGGNSATVNGHKVNADVPSGAKFTDTTYSAGTGLSLAGTTFNNSGVRAISTGTSNGTISVNTNGTTIKISLFQKQHQF